MDSLSDNQVWHLPTAPSLTGEEFIHVAARIFNTKPNYMRVSKLLLNVMGMFDKVIHGTAEMYNQYQYDYVFSSQKFEAACGTKPTSYEDGVKQLSMTLFSRKD